MIDYALAKELKDVGFPLPQEGTHITVCDDRGHVWTPYKFEGGELGEGMAYIPTLSELIEACGEKFRSLVLLENGKWGCASSIGDINGNTIKEIEATPAEAGARLWLALKRTSGEKGE